MKVKIHYHHTDCAGVVYYGRYLDFLEEARAEYFEEKGISIKELNREGISFVVKSQEIEYIKPVFYADTLIIKPRVIDNSSVRLVFDYDIRNQNGEVTTRAKTVVVCVDRDFRPQRLPQDLLAKLCLTQGR